MVIFVGQKPKPPNAVVNLALIASLPTQKSVSQIKEFFQ